MFGFKYSYICAYVFYMQLLVYLLVYPILWVISRLPFPIVYFISDGVYYLMYYIIGYRKKVVNENLHLAFPGKTDKEILVIQKKFYAHMCDIFLEIIKTMGMSVKEMRKRFQVFNHEIIDECFEQNRDTILFAGHYASWEWLLSMNTEVKPDAYAVYQKVNNKYFDKLVREIRGRFGTTLIRTTDARKTIAQMVNSNQRFVLGLASDQSPMLNRTRHWHNFMGIEVPIHVGAEEMSKKHNLVPIFMKVKKLKRGHYAATFKLITEHPNEMPDYQISETFMGLLEESITEAPEFYFWTHKRWKHRGKKPMKTA